MPDQDPETMPLEELMALANAEAPPTEEVFEVADPVAQPRNADGTFASPAPAVEVPAVPEVTPEPTSYSRTIDLGDGSGAQVFTAATKDELLDKLADAQKHATRKIRELNQVAKQVPKAPAKKDLTADEKYLLGQRLINEPDIAMRELLEAELGMSFDEFKTATVQARQITQERVEFEIGAQWLRGNPDFYNSESNGRKLRSYIARTSGVVSAENLNEAYQTLKADGLLQEKPAPTPNPTPTPTPAPRARASSLSSRISTIAAPPKGHTVDDMYKMSMDELAEHANRS